MEQSITVTDLEIKISGHLFVHKDFSFTGKELLVDAFSKHYTPGKKIKIFVWDGENLGFTNFITFLEWLANLFSITHSDIEIESHDPNTGSFKNIPMRLGIFLTTGRHLPNTFTHNLVEPKFVGTLLGRFNPTRFRLAYEIDSRWPLDNFMVFQPNINFVKMDFRHLTELYSAELQWLESKQFDKGMDNNQVTGTLGWIASTEKYPEICNSYQIEIVSETDAFSNFWFTEKIARCLAIGKPFVLISGPDSLKRLREMGFVTFEDIIDESYDQMLTPTKRIASALDSLNELYNASDKQERIKRLYASAELNSKIYKEYIKE